MADLGLPLEEFGLHSLRAGGATAAANVKVPDWCFKMHEKWKSENAKNGHIKDNFESRLEVLGEYIAFFVGPMQLY